jgi:hypothetical protein
MFHVLELILRFKCNGDVWHRDDLPSALGFNIAKILGCCALKAPKKRHS